jgi:hypothetical protein
MQNEMDKTRVKYVAAKNITRKYEAVLDKLQKVCIILHNIMAQDHKTEIGDQSQISSIRAKGHKLKPETSLKSQASDWLTSRHFSQSDAGDLQLVS